MWVHMATYHQTIYIYSVKIVVEIEAMMKKDAPLKKKKEKIQPWIKGKQTKERSLRTRLQKISQACYFSWL